MSATIHPLPTGRNRAADVRQALQFDADLIRRFDRNGPRYTSYPTADRFHERFDERAYVRELAHRRTGRPLSLYVHVPFCATLCFYCGCNKIATRDRSKGTRYVSYLEREIAMQAALLPERSRVEQIHLGGGTPTFLDQADLSRLMRAIRQRFDVARDAEISIEIDPRAVDAAGIERLAAAGFNRMSVGVQDFDPDVQRAVNRLQSEECTRSAIEAGRAAGMRSVNIDLIYGLPKQTMASLARTLEQVSDLSPDRIAFYNYAHLPELFAPQRRIDAADLPGPDTRLAMLGFAIERLAAAGYVHIGMDHFARPDDDLAIAQRQGRLQRNFQGYSTHAQCDLLGLGVSSIGMIGASYSQNQRTLPAYYEAIDHGRLPLMRGIGLSTDDMLRRSVIQALICQFQLCIETIETSWMIDFADYFAEELAELKALAGEGLLELDRQWITVTPRGRLLIRPICMIFDRYLREAASSRYSKVI